MTVRHSAAPTNRQLATPEDLAEFLNDIPLKTLAQWRSRGIGPKYRKVGRHVRYDWVGWSRPRSLPSRRLCLAAIAWQ